MMLKLQTKVFIKLIEHKIGLAPVALYNDDRYDKNLILQWNILA